MSFFSYEILKAGWNKDNEAGVKTAGIAAGTERGAREGTERGDGNERTAGRLPGRAGRRSPFPEWDLGTRLGPFIHLVISDASCDFHPCSAFTVALYFSFSKEWGGWGRK